MCKGIIAKGLLIGALTLTVKAVDACGYAADGTTLQNSCADNTQVCYVYQVTGTPDVASNEGVTAYNCADPAADSGVAALLAVA